MRRIPNGPRDPQPAFPSEQPAPSGELVPLTAEEIRMMWAAFAYCPDMSANTEKILDRLCAINDALRDGRLVDVSGAYHDQEGIAP